MILITKTVEFNKMGSADPGSCKVREMTDINPENAGGALGKPRGFGWWGVSARLLQLNLTFFFVN